MHPQRTSSKTIQIGVFVTAICFFFACLVFIPLLGIQNDEAIFASVQYGPIAREFRLRAFRHDVPLMVMTYLGALKTWIYAGIYALTKPTVWSLRVPPALIGSATIVLFSFLLTKAAKLRGAALMGAILLATDPSYLLTTVFDWGPVALQHFFLVSGALLVLHFAHTGQERSLGLGFAALGLGLWDKALLSWSLFGLGLAALLVFHTQLLRYFTRRNVAVAVLSFLAGCAPLALYNARTGLKTFRGNAKLNWAEVAPKWVHAQSTLDGSALFGYLVREEWETPAAPASAAGSLAEASQRLRERMGEQRRNWGYGLFLIAAAAVPLWWTRRRAVLFALIYLAAAWLLMAATHDAGASAHHVVLLWPFPHFVIAITLGCLAERFGRTGMVLAAAITLAAAGKNLLVVNQYYTQAAGHCGGTVWTDAIEPARQSLVRRNPKAVNIMGWGLEFSLTMLEKGKLPLRYAAAHVGEENPNPDDRNAIRAILEEENGIFVGHTAELEIQQGLGKRFETIAGQFGYRKDLLETVADRCGRPTFEIYRYLKN